METKTNKKENICRVDYDFAVIGSGPGGQRAAIQFAKKGKKTIVIDRREYKLGGVSLHSGTIPSKTLREAVLYLKGMRRRKVYGASRRFEGKITLKDLLERVEVILTYELKVIESQFKRNGVDVMYGQASFLDRNTIAVENRNGQKIAEIKAGKIVLATGTVPRHPDDVPFDYRVIFDSDFIFTTKNKIKSLPETLIVYGAGVIGSEYAFMFAALGCKVRLIDSHEDIFPFLDKDIVAVFKGEMEKLGIAMSMGKKYKKISLTPAGKGRLETVDGTVVEADAILFSKGRLPCIRELESKRIGLELSERGLVKVDETYRTSVDNIYACGDVIGFPALASTSAEQGRVAARYALGLESKYHKPELFPFAIYTIPEMSSIGSTEQELTAKQVPYIKAAAKFNEIAKAAIAGDDTGLLKILFHPESREILGVHIIGDQAAEIVHIGQAAMALKGKLDFFINNVFNYPTWAEAYKTAALKGFNILKQQ
ncbi:MAG: Si-specific NAD(P)(+) transhydrogenase [Candidatus Aminicenantes bacterium]|nr:Si-specific NAD(P)(+) transhydrogenase [Candidatus Aminicenantes bacterium]